MPATLRLGRRASQEPAAPDRVAGSRAAVGRPLALARQRALLVECACRGRSAWTRARAATSGATAGAPCPTPGGPPRSSEALSAQSPPYQPLWKPSPHRRASAFQARPVGGPPPSARWLDGPLVPSQCTNKVSDWRRWPSDSRRRDRMRWRQMCSQDGCFATSITTIDNLRFSSGESELTKARLSASALDGLMPWGGAGTPFRPNQNTT